MIQFVKKMFGQRLFALTCFCLGLLAFIQLLIAGIAIAVRIEERREVKIIEREVEKIVPSESALTHQSSAGSETEMGLVPEPESLTAPKLDSPRSERLVNEAKKARIAGDMGTAIVKLEEILTEAPNVPTALYELGMVHETMGVYDKAADYYEKVFQLGVSSAGNLYEVASRKLRDGFEQAADALGNLSLGRVRIFNDTRAKGGQRVILTIPVQKAPGYKVDASEIEVAVTFFNKRNKGEIIQLKDDSWAQSSWPTLPFDWVGGEESLQMIYQIPVQDLQTEHLLGQQTYYGQVVTLSYKGEILDVQAWPRDLAARMGRNDLSNPSEDLPEFLGQDALPPDFDPSIPLLNSLPSQ